MTSTPEHRTANETRLAAAFAAERGPGIRQAQASAKTCSKLRAATAFRSALHALRWSQRRAATWVGVDERIIRDWLEAGQQPAWIPLALPREGYMVYLETLFGEAPRTGTDD